MSDNDLDPGTEVLFSDKLNAFGLVARHGAVTLYEFDARPDDEFVSGMDDDDLREELSSYFCDSTLIDGRIYVTDSEFSVGNCKMLIDIAEGRVDEGYERVRIGDLIERRVAAALAARSEPPSPA